MARPHSQGSDRDGGDVNGSSKDEFVASSSGDHAKPVLFHKVRNQRSILAIAVSDSKIYAGTEEGELLVGSQATETSILTKMTC